MGYGAKTLLELTREFVSDASPGDNYGNNVLLKLLDAMIMEIMVKLANETDVRQLTYRDVTYVSGTELYYWNSFITKIAALERTDLSPRANRYAVGFKDRLRYINGLYTDYPEVVYDQGTQIGVTPVPTATATLRVWRPWMPAPLHYGTAVAGGATSITLDSTPTYGSLMAGDDVYNGMPIVIESGTGIGQANIISDYVHSTNVATVAFTWSVTPSTDSVYGLAPPLPEAFHLLPAIMVGDLSNRTIKEPGVWSPRAEAMFQELVAHMSPSVDTRPKVIREYGF